MTVTAIRDFKFCGKNINKGDTLELLEPTAKIYEVLKLIELKQEVDTKPLEITNKPIKTDKK